MTISQYQTWVRSSGGEWQEFYHWASWTQKKQQNTRTKSSSSSQMNYLASYMAGIKSIEQYLLEITL